MSFTEDTSFRLGADTPAETEDQFDLAELETAMRRRLGLSEEAPEPSSDAPTDVAGDGDAGEGEGEGSAASSSPPPSPDEPAPQWEDAEVPTEPQFVIGDEHAPEPVPEPVSQPEATVDGLDLNRFFEAYLGRRPDRAEVVQLLEFVDNVNKLPVDQQQTLTDMLTGRYQPAPAPAPQPARPAPPADPWGIDEPVQPTVPPEVEAKIAELEQQVAQVRAAEQQREMAVIQAGISDGVGEFERTHPELTVEEVTALQLAVNRSQAFGPLYTQTRDARQAMLAAMEQQMWTNPTLRERVVAAKATETTPTPVERERQRKASAVAASTSGTSPLQGLAPPPAAPSNMGDARLRIAQELSRLESGQ